MSKVVVARYVTEEVFKIPKGLDLEDKSKVKTWYVRYAVLHIILTSGEVLKVTGEGWIDRFDYKHPSLVNGKECVNIENAADCGIEEEEEEE